MADRKHSTYFREELDKANDADDPDHQRLLLLLDALDEMDQRESAPSSPAAEVVDVVAAVRKKDGRYWVGKRNSDGAHAGLKGLWEYPGGKIEPDEQLREALVRELQEEFPGCLPTIGAVLDSINAAYGDAVYRVTFFEVEMDDPTETPCHSEVGWFTPGEVCQMAHLPSGTIFNARHLALTAQTEQEPAGYLAEWEHHGSMPAPYKFRDIFLSELEAQGRLKLLWKASQECVHPLYTAPPTGGDEG